METGDYIGSEVKTTMLTEAGWKNGQSRQLLEGGLGWMGIIRDNGLGFCVASSVINADIAERFRC